MHFHISRNGQTYGPYTLEDLERYLASGNILTTDLARPDDAPDEPASYRPVAEILQRHNAGQQPGPGATGAFLPPGTAAPYSEVSHAAQPYGAPYSQAAQPYQDQAFNPAGVSMPALASSPYPDAPNLNWTIVLLISVLTCGLFMPIWNIVVAAWLKRVQPNAISVFLYIGYVVLAVLQVFTGGVFRYSGNFHGGLGALAGGFHPIPSGIFAVAWLVKLFARYSQRASLEEHFNTVEPVGLRLDAVMTFFFGGLYFQYHLNRINALKQAARFSTGRTY